MEVRCNQDNCKEYSYCKHSTEHFYDESEGCKESGCPNKNFNGCKPITKEPDYKKAWGMLEEALCPITGDKVRDYWEAIVLGKMEEILEKCN